MALLIIRLKSKKIAVSEYDFEEVPEQHFQVEKNQFRSRFLVHISLQKIQPIRNCNPKNQLLSRFLVHISLQRIQPIRNCNPKNQLLSRFLVHILLQRIQPIRSCNPKKSISIKILGAHFITKNSTN